MLSIHRIGELTLERRNDRLCVHFKLNHPPDKNWIGLFKAHAASSILGASNAIFNGTVAYVEVTKPSTTPELATALDCFIECANLRLRSLPGPVPDERPAESPRPRLVPNRFRPRV